MIMGWTDKEDITFKEQILAKVRNALIEKPEAMFKDIDQRTETWVPISEEDGTAVTFAQNFKELGGVFIYLDNENEFGECLHQLAPENGWEPLWCTSPAMQAILNRHGVAYSETPVAEAKKEGVLAFGPFSASKLFVSGTWKKYDAILALTYDQGVLPFKLMSVNGYAYFWAGLPAVCTAPLHGPNFDIANTNTASPDALRKAVYLAVDILKNRKEE